MKVTQDPYTATTATHTVSAQPLPYHKGQHQGGDLAEMHNPELYRLIGRYLEHQAAMGILNAERSRYVVRRRLLQFCASTECRPENLSRRQIESYLSRNLAASTRAAELSTLRGFCGWLMDEGIIDKDPTRGVRRPKIAKGLPRDLNPGQVRRLFEVVGNDPRHRLILLLMVEMGLRRIEVSRAQLGDVDLHDKTIEVRGKGFGGQVSRLLPLLDDTYRALKVYLDEERGTTVGPLILNRRDRYEGVEAHTLSEMVRGWMREAGLKVSATDGVSAHALRHTCAQSMVDAGVPLRVVQQWLGHASIKTTEGYARREVSGLREAAEARPSYFG